MISNISNILLFLIASIISSTLALQLPKSDRKASSYLSIVDENHFQFSQISKIKVLLILEDLDTKKFFGIDRVYLFLLRSAALQVYTTLIWFQSFYFQR